MVTDNHCMQAILCLVRMRVFFVTWNIFGYLQRMHNCHFWVNCVTETDTCLVFDLLLISVFEAGSSWVCGVCGVGAAEGRVWLWVRATTTTTTLCLSHAPGDMPTTTYPHPLPPYIPHTHNISRAYLPHTQNICTTHPSQSQHIIQAGTHPCEGYNDKTHMLHHQERGTGYLLESYHSFVRSTKHFWVGTLGRYCKVEAHL